MDNNKAMAIICWGISILAFLSAFLISIGNLSKAAIFILGISIIWFILGMSYWRKRKKKK